MRNILQGRLLVAVAAAVLALPALGSPEPDAGYENSGRFDTARVLDVQPVTRLVSVSEPRRECWDEASADRRPREHGGVAGSMVLGGLLGGAIGSAFGSGRGKDAATVAGVLIGSSRAHDKALEAQERASARQNCTVAYDWHDEERADGFRVTYEFGGETYVTHTSRDPGKTIRVWISVRPVGY